MFIEKKLGQFVNISSSRFVEASDHLCCIYIQDGPPEIIKCKNRQMAIELAQSIMHRYNVNRKVIFFDEWHRIMSELKSSCM